MKALLIPVAFLLVIAFVGCASLPMESNLQKPVSMSKVKDVQGKDFMVTKQAVWLFWGAVPLSVPTVDEIVGPLIADHEGVQNLKVTTEYNFINFILSAITQGVVYSQTVTIQGKVFD
jgi:hypothetical protein